MRSVGEGMAGTLVFERQADRTRLLRFAAASSAVVLLAFGLAEGAYTASMMAGGGTPFGWDFALYLERTRDWLAGGGYYLPVQLTGQPYELGNGTATYPPLLLYLTVPFTVLPALLWWAIPLAVIGFALWRLRPAWWTWPLLAIVACYPRTWVVLLYGNPSMWVVAASAAGMLWRWPSVFAVLKPTLAPLALFGANRRAWWLSLAVLLVLAVPFGLLWRDYAIALVNARSGALGLEYLWGEWPIALVPLIAWLGRTKAAPANAGAAVMEPADYLATGVSSVQAKGAAVTVTSWTTPSRP